MALLFLVIITPTKTYAATIGFVNADWLNVRSGPGLEYPVIGHYSYQNIVLYDSAYDTDGDCWYLVDYAGTWGYVSSYYVTNVHNESETAVDSEQADASFEEQLAKFPVCYHPYLKNIHNSYPNYVFVPDYLSITFDDAVYQETLDHRKLVDLSYDGYSWRSLNPAAYAGNYSWYSFAGGWTDAAVDVIEYYMDPRNFLNLDKMYIFAKQSYSSNESVQLVKNILGATFMSGSYTDSTGTHDYAETIMEAAKNSGVSAYVIAAILAQEQGAYITPLCDGSRGSYNFFNYGANGSSVEDVIANGASFAASCGWTTVYASILGGACIYQSDYVAQNQDTYFYKDYNLVNQYFYHQYAQSVYDQIGNGFFLASALKVDRGACVTLRIPVYKTMPADPCPCPDDTPDLNTRYDAYGNYTARSGKTIEMVPAGKSDSGSSTEGSETPSEKPEESETPVTPVTPETPENPSTPETPSVTYIKGDANGDGKISPADYVMVKNYILKKYTFTDPAKQSAADATGDGKISPADYVKIKNMILGK